MQCCGRSIIVIVEVHQDERVFVAAPAHFDNPQNIRRPTTCWCRSYFKVAGAALSGFVLPWNFAFVGTVTMYSTVFAKVAPEA